jgi:hypothetical protein
LSPVRRLGKLPKLQVLPPRQRIVAEPFGIVRRAA